MSNAIKVGLSYFAHDTDLWDDPKIDYLTAKHKLIGYGFYLRLLEIAYKEKGYYVDFNESNLIRFSAKSYLNVEQVKEILNDCLKQGLFDESLYIKHQIITSKRLQIGYIKGCERRTCIYMIEDYLLINPHDYLGSKFKGKIELSKLNSPPNDDKKDDKNYLLNENVYINRQNVDINRQNVDINRQNVDINLQRKEKKIKEKKIKEKEYKVLGKNLIKNDIENDTKNDTKIIANKGNDLIDDLLVLFQKKYLENRGFEFEVVNKGKQRSSIGKLLNIYKKDNKSLPKTTEETINDFSAFFDACLNIPDNWLRNNMSPSLILSKFNEIRTILRNNNNGRTNSLSSKNNGATYEDILESIEKSFSAIKTET